jgi:hypothetical protein
MNGEEYGMKEPHTNWKNCQGISDGTEQRKTTYNICLIQDSRFLEKLSNPRLPEYKAGLLVTESRSSVIASHVTPSLILGLSSGC